MVKLFLILTVGWFIYAFIRFTRELIQGLAKLSARANDTQKVFAVPAGKVRGRETEKNSFKSKNLKND